MVEVHKVHISANPVSGNKVGTMCMAALVRGTVKGMHWMVYSKQKVQRQEQEDYSTRKKGTEGIFHTPLNPGTIEVTPNVLPVRHIWCTDATNN